MKLTITPDEMKELETRFMAENAVPGALLMEHAAMGVVDAIARYTDKGTVVFLCGPGNNGGDGFVMARVLEKVGERFGHAFKFTPYLIGGSALDACGEPLPKETVEGCLAADSVLLGAVGGPKWDTLPGNKRPEKALLGIRSKMELFTNLRPAKLYPALKGECPLREDLQVPW